MATYEATKYNFTGANISGATYVATGTIVPYTHGTAPTGYLECDGSAVSRSTYATLFTLIGTTYGAGDGSSTFTLPDLKDKVIYGKSSSVSLAATGGSADATLVSHNHTATSSVSDSGHFHNVLPTLSGAFANNGGFIQTATTGTPSQSAVGNTDTKTTGITVSTSIASNGSSATNANLQPYLCLKFMIKT
tara:strand:+ start:646 stop:1218 length:573 start_codon:yes stop_codon:yes gene_type:complete